MPAALPKSTHLRTPPGVIVGDHRRLGRGQRADLLAGVFPHADGRGRNATAVAAAGECGAERAGDDCAGDRLSRDPRAPHPAPPRVDGRRVLLLVDLSGLVPGELHAARRDALQSLQPWWPFYWKLLASHIVLSTVALPLILITFFLSLTGRFPAHKKIARWTFPIWLYVSVTGVVVYLMQAACR